MALKHVTLAMSGGVDSAAAALLLRQAGFDVSAVTLRLHRETDRPGICGSGDDIALARSVAESLGMPHTVVDLCGLFREVDNFFVGLDFLTLPTDEFQQAVDFFIADEGALHALRFRGAYRVEEHIALAQELLRAAHIEDRT